MGTTAAISIRQVGTQPVVRTVETRTRSSILDWFGRFRSVRLEQQDRSRARRTALANFEEARIHAQVRYRKMRYRHMQI